MRQRVLGAACAAPLQASWAGAWAANKPSLPPAARAQAIGATTPAFTALLGYMIGHQRESRTVYLSLVPVVVGVVIASGAEVRP